MKHSKQSISIMFCGSPEGTYLLPMVVYRAQNVYGNWIEGGPRGTIYDCTKSGWFDSVTFEKWFFKIFLPNACALSGPVALIGDNLGSHFSKAVVDACLQNNVMFITLALNSMHLTQPLDVAVFRPAKIHWKNILIRWRKESKTGCCIPKSHFPRLLILLFGLLSWENLKSRFSCYWHITTRSEPGFINNCHQS